ncbi:hypothetical protein ACC735_29825, partial [Rhizobium ruizarguesonis]
MMKIPHEHRRRNATVYRGQKENAFAQMIPPLLSTPIFSAISLANGNGTLVWGVGVVGLGPEGREFESLHSDHSNIPILLSS